MPLAWLELSRSALLSNLRLVRRMARGREVFPMLKHNAYGQGALPIARVLDGAGIRTAVVACADEAEALARALPRWRVILGGACPPEKLAALVRAGVGITLHTEAEARRFSRTRARLHLKIDTGMGRLGIPWERALPWLVRLGPRLESVFSVLAEDPQFDLVQAERFERLKSAAALSCPWHLAASAALVRGGPLSGEAVRPGSLLFGYPPFVMRRPPPLKPVASLRIRVVQVRRLAPGDSVGFRRAYRPKRREQAVVLASGELGGFPYRRAILGGRIFRAVSGILVGIPPSFPVKEGQVATLLGASGGKRITMQELGGDQGVDAYQALGRLPARVARGLVP